MDNKRIVLWGALGILLWLNFMSWQRDYPAPVAPASVTTPGASSAASLPTLPAASSAASGAAATPAITAPSQAATGRPIRVVTDVLDITINTRGGDIVRADLLKYATSKQDKTPVRLLNDSPERLFVVRTGLLATDTSAAPTHLVEYTAAQDDFRLAPGQDELPVTLSWRNEQGVSVEKTFVFKRGSYAVDVNYSVNNASMQDWSGAAYVQVTRHDLPVSYSMFNAETISYRGPAVYDGKAYHKLQVNEVRESEYKQSFSGGWMAAMQHHFVVAAVPPADQSFDYSVKADSDNDFMLTTRGPLKSVAAGATGTFNDKLFIGPKLQQQLEATGSRLELTADYGKLTIIAQPLFWLLQKVHQYVGNWGIAIIIVTLLIKAVFYKLTAASGRSMAKMRNLSPRIKSLQDRFKDDREQLGRAMMDLYKKEKINPLAGCLPMLIQIPFFMGFYWVLLESVEMRQAPFFAWITDLSARDPFFILPILMGVANYAQFKLNPAPTDPMQAKVMAFMPLIMTVMMAWFPSGLVLYWITNTLVSALQQWRINKLVEGDARRVNAS